MSVTHSSTYHNTKDATELRATFLIIRLLFWQIIMTPKESFLARLRMEDTAYIPVFPRNLTLGLGALGLTYDSYLDNITPEKSARCVLELQRMCGYDVTVGYIRTTRCSPFGGKISRSINGMPQLSEAPFKDIDNMEKHYPEEAVCDIERISCESSRIVAKERPDLALVCNVCTPLLTATILRGMESFVMDMMLNPDILNRLMDFGTKVAEIVLENSIIEETDCVFLAAANDNPDLIGDEPFERLSPPGVKRMVDIAHEHDIPAIFHPHGVFSSEKRLPLLRKTIESTGIEGFQFAEGNDPKGILSQTEGRCAILGGVDAFTTLMMGPDERIIKEIDAFLDVLEGHNYIPMCSCSVHLGMPIDSIRIMTEAAHSYRQRHDRN